MSLKPNAVIGRIVRKRRIQLEMTLRGFAELAGVDHGFVLRLERGDEVRLSEFIKIAQKYSIEIPRPEQPPPP